MMTQQSHPEATFRRQWLQAISHLSVQTKKAIIADVVEYQLTGNITMRMSGMRRALFNSFILELNPEADITVTDNPSDCLAQKSIVIEDTRAEKNDGGSGEKASRCQSRPQKRRSPKRPVRDSYAPVEKSPYSEEDAVYGADVPEYFIFPDENLLGRFINDPSGYGCLVDNKVPEFTVPLSEVRSVVDEWIERRRGFLDYRQFRDRLIRVFHGEQMQKYRKEHPIPVSVW